MEEHVVIIGNGISGVTAARHIRKKSNKRITIISSETDCFFSRTALMYVYMGHMKFENTQPYEPWFWKKNRIELKKAFVERIEPDKNLLHFAEGGSLEYDTLILATGSKPNKFGWPGQDLDGVQGLYSKGDLDMLEKNAPNNKVCKRAVIVGGGLIGIEMAEMLVSRNIPVTFLVREDLFWNGVLPKEEATLITEHIKKHHIDLRTGVNLEEIIDNGKGQVKSIIIKETGEEILCDVVGLTAGVSPNIEFVKTSGIETGRGIKVNRLLQTNYKNVYAIGDCAEQREAVGNRRPIEAVWYTGRIMGETVAKTICEKPIEYQPGHWFNSAKFIEVEYQTYGWIWAKPKENEERYCWQHPKKNLLVHFNFDKNTRAFIGMNTFGIRMRHEIFDRWLHQKKSIDYVISHLIDANFDPEFYKQYEAQIIEGFNKSQGTNLRPAKKNLKRIFSKIKA